VRGRFEGRPDGDGWVIPEEPDGAEDIHITRGRLGGTLPGDLVDIEPSFRTRRGRLEGAVVRVVQRGASTVVGLVTAERTVAVWDRQWAREILLPEGGALPGDLVEVRIRRYPVPGQPVIGEVTSVFGPADEPRAELLAVLAKYSIRDEFPPAALAQAEAAPAAVAPGELGARENLRGRLILTMDPEDARDHDDAIEAAELPDGGFEIGVHIADVSHYVPPGSPVDEEAALRGTSAYFPERAVPMLPEALSSGICSLFPDVDRLVRSVRLRIGPDGRLRDARFSRSVIRSAARLSYEDGARLLGGGDSGPIGTAVRTMGRAAALLARARAERGAVDLDLPEPVVIADAEGHLLDARYGERNDAHRLVEDFMLLANQAVAERLRSTGTPALHRVHEVPDETRVDSFEDLLSGFGERLRVPSEPLRPVHCARLLARIEARPEAPFLRRKLLRAMRKAVYSPRAQGHFALALPDYTHFTSPIRRYPDLVAHRALAAADGSSQGPDPETLPSLAASCSETERDAEAAERTLVERRIARLLAGRLGDAFSARVAETGRFGLAIELDEIPARGTVPMALLTGGRFRFHRQDHSLRCPASGRSFRLGDALEAQLVRVDPLRGDLEFGLLAEPPVAAPRPGKRDRRPRSRRR
ncbi:MAG: VacB/RNase II family 3'-5' exoribonuclease, partial [Acidobacteria bacterium]|nr:VacB/RNase II family 3'-5' exoribonuclease [Acidobacteriota bacterium]